MLSACASVRGTVPSMEMTVLVGDDQGARVRRAELLADAVDVERVDAAEDAGAALVGAIGSPSLFGPKRWIVLDNLGDVSDENWAQVAELAAGSDATVVAAVAKLDAASTRTVKAFATVEKFAAPTARNAKERVLTLAKASGVVLDSRSAQMLSERAGSDLERAESVVKALAIGGFSKPSSAQIETMLGSCTPDEMPWTLSDALERGDLGVALDAASRLEPIPTVAYLCSRLTQAGRALEVGPSDTAAVAEALGVKEFSARKACTLARRLGVDGVAASWSVLGGLDARVKTAGDPILAAVAVETALAQLVSVWAPRR